MKRSVMLFFLLSLLSAWPGTSAAQSLWEIDKPPHQSFSATYKLKYPFGVCYVDVSADGSGLTLVASYETSGTKLIQQITTRKKGGPHEQRFWFTWETSIYGSNGNLINSSVTNRKFEAEDIFFTPAMPRGVTVVSLRAGLKEDVRDPNGSQFKVVPDIFGKYCASPSKELPGDVQQLFYARKDQ